jgi:hypothetical protein
MTIDVKMKDESCTPFREQKLYHVRQAILFMKAKYFKLGLRTKSHTITRARRQLDTNEQIVFPVNCLLSTWVYWPWRAQRVCGFGRNARAIIGIGFFSADSIRSRIRE